MVILLERCTKPWPTHRRKWQIFPEGVRRNVPKEGHFELGKEEGQCRIMFKNISSGVKELEFVCPILIHTYCVILRWFLDPSKPEFTYLTRLFWKWSGISDVRNTWTIQELIDNNDKAGNEEQQRHQHVSGPCVYWGRAHLCSISNVCIEHKVEHEWASFLDP